MWVGRVLGGRIVDPSALVGKGCLHFFYILSLFSIGLTYLFYKLLSSSNGLWRVRYLFCHKEKTSFV